MIDIHCHILPGIDDGAKDMEEAVAMAQVAYEDGIRHIVATPHFTSVFLNTRDIVIAKVRELQEQLDRRGIGVQIYPGNEVRFESADFFYGHARSDRFHHLDPDRKFVLLEMRWADYDPATPEAVAWLTRQGITPIIPHPERHGFFRSHPQLLVKLIEAGAWTQVSADSLLGKNSDDALNFAYWLLDRDYVFTLATDAHNTRRKPNLSEGFRLVREHAGEARADQILARMKSILALADE